MKSLLQNSLTILCLLFTQTCLAQHWIVGGQNASQGQFPWIADFRDSEYGQTGTGSLVKPQWVLTNAFTALIASHRQVVIRFNSVASGGPVNPNGGQVVEIDRNFIYPTWTTFFPAPLGDDIALLKLKEPITNITPINLANVADTATAYLTDAPVKIAGWGIYDNTASIFSDTLRWATSKVFDKNICNSINQTLSGAPLNNRFFCVGMHEDEPVIGSSNNDQGGPAWTSDGGNNKIIGVASGVIGNGALPHNNKPSLYIKVAYFRQWIDSVIAANTPTAIGSIPQWDDTKIKIGTPKDGLIIYFKDLDAQNASINLFNMEGKLMLKSDINHPANKNIELATSGFATGLYMIRISDNNGHHFTKKIALIE